MDEMNRIVGMGGGVFYPQITQMDTDKDTSAGWDWYLWASVASVDKIVWWICFSESYTEDTEDHRGLGGRWVVE